MEDTLTNTLTPLEKGAAARCDDAAHHAAYILYQNGKRGHEPQGIAVHHAGDFFEAYEYIKRAINAEDEDRKLDSHLYKYVGCQTCEDNEKRIYILSPTERCRTTNKVTSMSRSEMFM